MNKDIYNPRVANLEQEISKLEKEILDGTYKMENTFHLDLLYEKINALWKEYENIYNEIENPISKKQLLEYLKKEIEFLKLLTSLVKSLNHYKQVVGDFIETSVLEKVWDAIQTVLFCDKRIQNYYQLIANQNVLNLNHSEVAFDYSWLKAPILDDIERETNEAKNLIEEVGNATERINQDYQKDKEKIKTLSDESNKTIKEAISAIDRLYAVVDGKMIDYEVEAKDFKEENRKDIIIDEEYLKTLSLVERMEYIKLVMQNIINSKGKKRRVRYNEEIVSIPEKYYGKWMKCQTKMKQCIRQYEKEVVDPLLEEQNVKRYKEEYAKLYSDFQQVNDRLLSLAANAKRYINTNQVVAVASLNKEPLYVLKTSLNCFNTYFVEYKRLQKELLRFSERNHLKVPTIASIENVEEAEKEIYNQIYLLKNETVKKEGLDEDTSALHLKIKQLNKQLYQMNKGKRFALFANLKVLFKSTLLAEDISTFYAEVVEKLEYLVKSKKYTDKEKESILKDIFERMNRCIANSKETTPKVKNTLIENGIAAKKVLQEQMQKVKRGIQLLPKMREKTFKIDRIRDVQNKKRIALAVGSAAAITCAYLGIQGLTNMEISNEVIQNKNMEAIMDDEVITSNIAVSNSIDVTSQTSSIFFENEYLDHAEVNNVQALFQRKEETKESAIASEKEQPKVLKNVSHVEIITPKEIKTPSYSKEVENKYVDFGDAFTTNEKKVYQNYLDAAHEENVLKSSNPLDTIRTVDGITYEYNGEYIFVGQDQEDAQAIKNALEANGAKQVNYRGANENGWEGYFVDENVTFTNEGRGR